MIRHSFPDVNVWFALAVADHPQHEPAATWWNEETSLAAFCRLTQLGLLRLLTTPSAMGGLPLTNAAAWSVYEGLLSDERVAVFRSCRQSTSISGVYQPFAALLRKYGRMHTWRHKQSRTTRFW